MRIQPVGYTFFRGGRVLPRHMVAEEPALKRIVLPGHADGYDFIAPRPGASGALPRLTLYGADGVPETVYFGPSYGKQPKTRAEAIARAMGGETCEACRIGQEKGRHADPAEPVKPPEHAVLRFPAVQLYTAYCSNCGRLYVSGGLTDARDDAQPETARLDMGLLGQYIDIAV
ncbi:MAG: hypothetical protein LBH95_01855 [Oscillospiraceae bacterium]|jgi:hypothetical protein|nr:hypothetical protein [Oscillospiraceae bacterium]